MTINTPCLVVDEGKTLANIEKMARRIAAHGLRHAAPY